MSDCKDKKHSIGGQALIEGVMMRSRSAMVLAVKGKDGEILIESKRIKARPKFWRLPVLRGIYSFGSSLVTGVTTITKAAEVADIEGDEGEKVVADAGCLTEKKTDKKKKTKNKESCAGGQSLCPLDTSPTTPSPSVTPLQGRGIEGNFVQNTSLTTPSPSATPLQGRGIEGNFVSNTGEQQKGSALGGFAMFIAIFLALALSIGIFFFIPRLVSDAMQDHIFDVHFSEMVATLFNSIVRGIISLVLFIAYLLIVSLLKDIRRNFQYHGAEHKTINCYEAGDNLTVDNVKKHSTKHNRCGTTFMFLVIIIGIVVFMFVDLLLNWVFSIEHGLYIEHRIVRNLVFMPIRLFIFLPIVAGISFEILFLLAKMGDNWFVKALRAPGLALQRLTTKEPDEKMIEVAIAAFELTLRMEEDKGVEERRFYELYMNEARDMVRAMVLDMGIEGAEADWMLCFVLNCKRSELLCMEKLTGEQGERLRELIRMRRGGVPLDYCFGMSSFYGRDVAVDNRVLVPRSETEILCEKAIEWTRSQLKAKGSQLSILDMCTGSGCIALTLANELKAGVSITATDISEGALEVAKKNLVVGAGVSDCLNIELVKSDLFQGLSGRKFDLIVCNPPYIKTGDISTLQNEVKVQPHLALDGGEDGLDFYRKITGEAREHLNDDGAIMFEVGMGQANDVLHMLRQHNFNTAVYKDMAGIDRVVIGLKHN